MLIKLKMNGVREIHANSLEALREQVPLPLLTKLESMVDSIVVHEKNYFARNELSPQDWIEMQSDRYIADQKLRWDVTSAEITSPGYCGQCNHFGGHAPGCGAVKNRIEKNQLRSRISELESSLQQRGAEKQGAEQHAEVNLGELKDALKEMLVVDPGTWVAKVTDGGTDIESKATDEVVCFIEHEDNDPRGDAIFNYIRAVQPKAIAALLHRLEAAQALIGEIGQRAATGMRYTRIEDGLPPEQKNIVVMLKSGIPLLGRNIGGEFCQYDQINDRFVEWGSTDPWGGIESWFEVIPPELTRPENLMLCGRIKSDLGNRQHLESLGVTVKDCDADNSSFDVELSKAALDEVLKFGADYEWHFERSVPVIDTHPPCQNFAGRTAQADPAP